VRRRQRHEVGRTVLASLDDASGCSFREQSGHEVVVRSMAVQEGRERDRRIGGGGGEKQVARKQDKIRLHNKST
jgi:hypothetical protein